MADVNSCPDPCEIAKAPEGCSKYERFTGGPESDNRAIFLDFNLNVLSTRLVDNICDCEDVIDLAAYGQNSGAEEEILEKLNKLKLVITAQGVENPNNARIKGKATDLIGNTTGGDALDGIVNPGTTATDYTVDLNDGAGIEVPLSKIGSNLISQLSLQDDYNPCCLKPSDASSSSTMRLVGLGVGGKGCMLPDFILMYFRNINANRKYPNGKLYPRLSRGTFLSKKIPALTENGVELIKIEKATTENILHADYITGKLHKDPNIASRFKNETFNKNFKSTIDAFAEEYGAGSNEMVALHATTKEVIATLFHVYDQIVKTADIKGDRCYNFSKLLGDNRGVSEISKKVQTALEFLQDPCKYSKDGVSYAAGMDLCDFVESLGKNEKNDEGEYPLNKFSVKLVSSDTDTELSECYSDIPVSAKLSGSIVEGRYIFNITITVGSDKACNKEDNTCNDAYYALVSVNESYDFTDAENCDNLVSCEDVKNEKELQEKSGITDAEVVLSINEGVTILGRQNGKIYQAIRCKKCEDKEVKDIIESFEQKNPGVCCKEAVYEVTNILDMPKNPNFGVLVDLENFFGPNRSEVIAVGRAGRGPLEEDYQYFNDKSNLKECCDIKGKFTFTTNNEKINQLKNECLPPAICCVSSMDDAFGTCYYQVVDTNANISSVDLSLNIDATPYTIDPNDCNLNQDKTMYVSEYTPSFGFDVSKSRVVPLFKQIEIKEGNVDIQLSQSIILPNYGVTNGIKTELNLDTVSDRLDFVYSLNLVSNTPKFPSTGVSIKDFIRDLVRSLLDNEQKLSIGAFVNAAGINTSEMSEKEKKTEAEKIIQILLEVRSKYCFPESDDPTSTYQRFSDKFGKPAQLNGRLGDAIGDAGTGRLYEKFIDASSSSMCKVNKGETEKKSYTWQMKLCNSSEYGSLEDLENGQVSTKLRQAITEAVKEGFSPGACVYKESGSSTENKLRSACMDESCCRKYCEDNGFEYVKTEKSSGSFYGFSDIRDWYTSVNKFVPRGDGYIEYTEALETDFFNEVVDKIIEKNEYEVGIKTATGGFVKASDDRFRSVVKGFVNPCKSYMAVKQIKTYETEEDKMVANLKNQCRIAEKEANGNQSYRQRCLCVDTGYPIPEPDTSDSIIIAELNTRYNLDHYLAIIVRGPRDKTKIDVGKLQERTIGVELGQVRGTGKIVDTGYVIDKGVKDELPDNNIEVTIQYEDNSNKITATVTKSTLITKARIFDDQNLTVDHTKAVIKYNLGKTIIDVGELVETTEDGCIKIEAKETSYDNRYIPANVVCLSQNDYFRKTVLNNREDYFVTGNDGYGGVVIEGATECTDNICDGVSSDPIVPPEEDEGTPVEPDTPAVPESPVSPDGQEEYEAALNEVNRIKRKINIALKKFDSADKILDLIYKDELTQGDQVEYAARTIDLFSSNADRERFNNLSNDDKRSELERILEANFFGTETITVTDGSPNGFVIRAQKDINKPRNGSLTNLIEQLDTAGIKLSNIIEKYPKGE